MHVRKPAVFAVDRLPAPPGAATSGMDRREIIDAEGAWIGWVRTDAGFAGGWHHHGDRDSYIYVVKGELTMEYGIGGGESLIGRPGDVIFNPAHLVHREVTPGESVEALVIRLGTGPLNVNVDGPDSAA